MDKEKKDVRGRTPLMLAVTLNFIELVRILLSFDCNLNAENAEGWSGKCLSIARNMRSGNIYKYV